jgi:hypothetical protein
VLARSLAYVAAQESDRLIGSVNVAWDGGQYVFLLAGGFVNSAAGQGPG